MEYLFAFPSSLLEAEYRLNPGHSRSSPTWRSPHYLPGLSSTSSSITLPWPHRVLCWSWNTSGLLPPQGVSLTVFFSGPTGIPVANSVTHFKVLLSCRLLSEAQLSPLLFFFPRTCNILVHFLHCIYRKLLARMMHQGFQSDLFTDASPNLLQVTAGWTTSLVHTARPFPLPFSKHSKCFFNTLSYL